ncbi:HNH endonuclease [Bradyrhizobium tropiciagri]|uniref:HNH endonuclease n=1 Tax=Bradyrhizobium tropiciagri TaxID=312253 RepID=UPI001BACC7C7|nr:HNH endonuclease signature motif containing protein [Bradyrhizobium tropiciagri]MBR0868903.1 HNH endonuclease [Bradyrhizobium tropiciagri]
MRSEFNTKTRRAAYERSEGLCEGILASGERCNANLKHKRYHFDHIVPDAIGGDTSLQNCALLCVECHKAKTIKIDIPVIAKSKRVADNYRGISARAPKMRSQGFRRSAPQNTATRPIRKWLPAVEIDR